MNLSEFAKKIVAKNHFIKAGIGGFAGTGKTTTAAEIIIGSYKDFKVDKPLLFIDNEKGGRFLIPKFEKAGIKCLLKETTSLADVLQAIKFLQAGEIGFLFIDSLTKVYYQYVRDYMKNNKPSNAQVMYLNDWGKVIPAWQEAFSDVFVQAEGNIVFTGRGGYSYEKEEDETNEAGKVTKKGQYVKSGVKMKLAGETPFEPDLNVWMERVESIDKGKLTVYREAMILKDRSDLIDGKIFKNPKYKDFQPVVQYLINVPVGEVVGQSSDKNLAPNEAGATDYYKKKEASEIELEKIGDLFVKNDLGGTSAEAKKYNVLIKDKIFFTSSSTEIKKMSAPILKEKRLLLIDFFEGWGEQVDEKAKKKYIEDFEVLNADEDIKKLVETEADLPEGMK